MEKNPELRALYDKLVAEKDAITARSFPLREQRDAIVAQMQPLEKQAKALADQIHAIERPRLGELSNQIGKLAVALGGRLLSRSE